MRKNLVPLILTGSLIVLVPACGPIDTVVSGPSGSDGGSQDAGEGDGGGCFPVTETCDGLDNDCDGQVDEGFDVDTDGQTSCAGDCNDGDPAIHTGAAETANGKDDNCDGKVDNRVEGRDYDKDGSNYPQDCNDEEPLVGPGAVEVGGDKTDNNCNGQIDEPEPPCDAAAGSVAGDFAKAIGMCSGVESAAFIRGSASARSIRPKFGTQFTPLQGSNMVLLSTGKALDRIDDTTYAPQRGHDFFTWTTHPLHSRPRCAPTFFVPDARDMTELKLTLKVPQNAQSLSYSFNYFSAEYPEFVCTRYNDRFIAILESQGLDASKLPGGGANQCVKSAAVPTCNISYDRNDQPITVNNGFFDICVPDRGSNWENKCTKPVSMLEKTGYDLPDTVLGEGKVHGGATGWLTTKAPVKPGETITLRFIVLDEGDGILDSAVLLDNFKWDAKAVTAPVTDPSLN